MSLMKLSDPGFVPGRKCDVIAIVENIVGPAQAKPGADWRLNIELINLRNRTEDDDPNLPAGDRGAFRSWIKPGPTKSLGFQKIDRKLLPIVQPGDLVVIKSAMVCYGTQEDFKIMDVGSRIRKRTMIVYPAEIFENENFDEMCFDRHASIHGEKQENNNTFSTSIEMKLMDRKGSKI